MKNRIILISTLFFIVLAIMSFVGLQKANFYYAYNEKIILNKLDNKLIVRYNQNKNSDKKLISLYSELMDKSIDWKDCKSSAKCLPVNI